MATELLLFHRILKEEQQAIVLQIDNRTNGTRIAKDCRRCGACCVAFNIQSLGKKAGEICPYLLLTKDRVACGIYPTRPAECSNYDCTREIWEMYINALQYPRNRRLIELYSAQRWIDNIQKT